MFKQIIVSVFIIYFKLHLTNASPRIYLKELDLEDISNPKDTVSNTDVLDRAFNLIKRENDPQGRAAIDNCLLRNKDIKNKLSCISGVIERSERPQPYLVKDNDYFEMYPDIFITNPSRSKNFSQDYLDIKDLLRNNGDSTKKRKVIFKIVNPDNDLRRFNKLVNKKILRTVSASGSDSSDSDDTRKRIHYSSESSSDEKSREEKSREEKKKKKKAKVSSNSEMYMQSPSRIYEGRRRLPHFYPKRYHWNEDDLKELRNYWFNGPQGRYWGLHKTPY